MSDITYSEGGSLEACLGDVIAACKEKGLKPSPSAILAAAVEMLKITSGLLGSDEQMVEQVERVANGLDAIGEQLERFNNESGS